MIATLIRSLTSREPKSRSLPRRALRPTVDVLETRVALSGWSVGVMYAGTTAPPTTAPSSWTGTPLTPQVTYKA